MEWVTPRQARGVISLSRLAQRDEDAALILERVRGVEPLSSAWKAEVIPLYDTRAYIKF